MNKICTSLEQSQRLIELGVDVNTANMTWQVVRKNKLLHLGFNTERYNNYINELIPAWSLSALLDIIPNWTMDKTDKINLTCNPYDHCESCYEDPVDAAFEMICWLKENEKI